MTPSGHSDSTDFPGQPRGRGDTISTGPPIVSVYQCHICGRRARVAILELPDEDSYMTFFCCHPAPPGGGMKMWIPSGKVSEEIGS